MKKRFVELDLLRGLAVVGMVVFHFFFILDFYGVKESAMFSGWWHVLGQFVRFTFLGLVGVGMVISYERVREQMGACGDRAISSLVAVRCRWPAILRQWRRALIVGIAAMAVTVGTWVAVPEVYVRFGILHLIAVSIFFWSFFVEWGWVALGLSLVSFWMGGWFGWLGIGGLDLFGVGNFLVASSGPGGSTGIAYSGALDFFPVFPWIGVVGVGIFVVGVLYSRGESSVGGKSPRNSNCVLMLQLSHSLLSFLRSFLAKFWFGKTLIFLGKKALMIYLLHVPIIVGVLWVAGYVE